MKILEFESDAVFAKLARQTDLHPDLFDIDRDNCKDVHVLRIVECGETFYVTIDRVKIQNFAKSHRERRDDAAFLRLLMKRFKSTINRQMERQRMMRLDRTPLVSTDSLEDVPMLDDISDMVWIFGT